MKYLKIKRFHRHWHCLTWLSYCLFSAKNTFNILYALFGYIHSVSPHPVMKTILVIDFGPVKRILIPKHGYYFLVESSTLKAFESGLQLKESGILLKIIMQNPSSTDKDLNSVPRIQNPRLGIQNSRLSSNRTPLQNVLGGINLST